MRQSLWKVVGGVFLATVFSVAAWGAETFAQPGTLNYVEGQAQIGQQRVSSKSVGSTELQAGQVLRTEHGRAEVLLTPGVFLRVDDNSAVKLVSPSLSHTEVQLQQGRASVEVAEIHKANDLVVAEDGATVRLLKKGFYEFNSNGDVARVFKGEALVNDDGKDVKLKAGHELDLSGKLKPKKFNEKLAEDDFYRWSSLRADYLAEANVDAAQTYASNAPLATGWYWDPLYGAYTLIPGDGILYSPFGYGFYSPYWVYGAPWYYGYPTWYRYPPTGTNPHPTWGHSAQVPAPSTGTGHPGWGHAAVSDPHLPSGTGGLHSWGFHAGGFPSNAGVGGFRR